MTVPRAELMPTFVCACISLLQCVETEIKLGGEGMEGQERKRGVGWGAWHIYILWATIVYLLEDHRICDLH